MRTGLIILWVLGLFSGYAQKEPQGLLINGLQSSVLSIKGSTNVNCFECTFDSAYLETKTSLTYAKKPNLYVLSNAVFRLDLAGFDCGGKAINKDFREMLRAEAYPYVFLNFTRVSVSETGYEATVIISLAGKQHTYTVPIDYERQDLSHAKGKLEVNINDFQLEKPRKLMGLVVIDDVISIHFDIGGSVEDS